MSDLITAQTPTADHVRLALSLMADGAHMVLSGVPDDPSLATYSFPGHVSKALHAQLAALIREAEARGMERAAGILDTYETIDDESAARGVRWQVDLPSQIAAAIRAAKATP